MGLVAQRLGERAQTALREFDCTGTAQLRPFLTSVEQVKHRDVHDVGLDGIERRDQPLDRTRTRAGVLRQERFAAFADMQHDGAAFEQHLTVLVEDRHLAKGLHGAILGLVLIAHLQQAGAVGEARLFERPADAQIADLPCANGGTHRKAEIVIIRPAPYGLSMER